MAEIIRNDPVSHQAGQGTGLKPEDYIADMAAAKLVETLVQQMGSPSIVSKEFIVRQGIWEGLNHSKDNQTGYDCSMRNLIYKHVGKNSVNIDGKYFERIWAYLMKPRYIITQAAGIQGNSFEEDQPSLGRRILNRLTGKSNEVKQNG